MTAPVSISKSVRRAFEVLELFGTERRALTATEIGRRLALPQPSTRALLKTLVTLGYLDYASPERTYWPTSRLPALGQWLTGEPRVAPDLALALERIAGLADETTSLCTLRDGHVHILHVRKARHPVALQLEPGIGVAAWRTGVGRALLAALPGAEATGLQVAWLNEERSASGRRQLQSLTRELPRTRAAGYLAAYDLYLPGVGVVCVPLPDSRRGTLPLPLVVAVAGLRDRIRSRETALVRTLRTALRRPL